MQVYGSKGYHQQAVDQAIGRRLAVYLLGLMLRYYTDIAFQFNDALIKQYAIYIGKSRLTMADRLDGEALKYRYYIIDMHQVDYRQLLAQDTPDAIVLSFLGDFKDTPERQAVAEIVGRLHQKIGQETKQFREYFYMMEILSENRHLKDFIKEAEKMITQVKLQNLPSYALGMEQGEEKGLEKGISLMVHRLLKKHSPEDVAKMLELPLDKVLAIKDNDQS